MIAEGIGQVMVICGEAGLFLCKETEALWLPAPPVPVREAAGDTFAAGVIYAQNKTSHLAEQAAYGIALAEMSVERKGKYDLSELLQRMESLASNPIRVTNREAE